MNSSITLSGNFYSANNLNDFKNKINPELYSFLIEWFNKEDVILLKTSGSTGVAKTISVHKKKMILSAQKTGSFLNLEPGNKALCCLPLNYIAGKMMVVRAITLGLNLTVIEPSKAPFKDLKEDYIFSACTPHQLENSINDLSRIKILLVGGAPISEKTRVSLNGSKNKIYETFGMTETVSHVALKNISKGEKSFKALDGIRFKSSNGCLKIYNTELLGAPITTSDIVDLQSEKEFVWKGRQDFIINSGGIKINPEVVEKTLSGFFSTPFIVLGLPDNTLGEKLIIAFEKETPSNYSKAIEALSSFEKPKMVFNFINFKRVNNKILRRGVLKTILSINESN